MTTERAYHQARWNEPIILDMGGEGERGILLPEVEKEMLEDITSIKSQIPKALRRVTPPDLPQISQVEVYRHYLRLSQENLGAGFVADVGMATSTMKYNPPINERLASNPKFTDLHPLQDVSTVQGMLEIAYTLGEFLKEISGMDDISLQPRAGSQAIYANMAMIRAYHDKNGQGTQRDEVITTIFSHPSDAAAPSAAGYKIITLYPEKNGYPSIESLRSVVSERTAAFFTTNPDDTGIFNPLIKEFNDIVHAVGGLCAYDQANANGLLGIARAREAGFDLCHFNLHKTFSTPHASGGPATGVSCVTEELAAFLPSPHISFDGDRYYIDEDRPESIGKIGQFYGVAANFIRAYAWIMAHGAEGLKEVSEIAVLNNNYLMKKVLEIDGITIPYEPGKPRLDQIRYSWHELLKDTHLDIVDIANRSADYGMHFFYSHHPYVVPDPATLEPTESYSYRDLAKYADDWRKIATEVKNDPEKILTSPHMAPIHKMSDLTPLSDPEKWIPSWRVFKKKKRSVHSD